MKHLLAILLACLLLCGCAQTESGQETLPGENDLSLSGEEGLYDPDSPLERATGGALRVYPLKMDTVRGIRSFGSDILLFSGEETTTLTRLTGENLAVAQRISLGFYLDPGSPALQIGGDRISYYDPVSGETVVLDPALTVVNRIVLPEDISGYPILTSDRTTLYYCTAKAVKAWDLESGIRRTVKEMALEGQSVTGIVMEDTILQCSAGEKTLYLSAETGQLVRQTDFPARTVSREDRFRSVLTLGLTDRYVFGTAREQALLLPAFDGECVFLPEKEAAVEVHMSGSDVLQMDYYDLSSGLRKSSLTLETGELPEDLTVHHQNVCILIYDSTYGCHVLLQWDPEASAIRDDKVYKSAYSTREHPDEAELALCQAYADQIGSRHGIQILVGPDAADTQPWDYTLEAEYLPGVLWRELELLEQRLDAYPEGMLADTASPFDGLTLCLVRSIRGISDTESIASATGVQFLEGGQAYVAICVGTYARQALYHELFHVMETHIFNESIAFDRWDSLNPSGFDYDYDFAANALRDSGIYLVGENRAFVDTYSMSFPKEDRARIMENAMLPGREALFASPILQAKLNAICLGIREAYGLKKSPETYLWEQYLEDSLAYKE